MSEPPSPAPHASAALSHASQRDECHVYLLRHGATANNVAQPPRIQGQKSDEPLSEAGKRQARDAAQTLAGVGLAAVYTSPLVRAQETAAIVAASHHLEVMPIAALVECDVGRWEGRTWDDVRADDAEAFAQFIADPATHPYAGGENLEQVAQRANPAIETLVAKHLGQTIAIVAHNVLNRAVLAKWLEISLSRSRDALFQNNGGINLVRWKAGHPRVLMVNGCLHLRDRSG